MEGNCPGGKSPGGILLRGISWWAIVLGQLPSGDLSLNLNFVLSTVFFK